MSIRITSVFLTLVAISAAGAGGYYAGSNGFRVEGLAFSGPATSKPASASATGPVIYYRDPDGKPFYAASPRKTAEGRDFLPVLASEDLNFDDQASLKEKPSATGAEPSAASARKILYYRNPMGLPDTSPVPKKDSMGMDYLPVYDGEDSDDGTLKISLGKMQRTGVRSERAASRVLSVPVRASGTIQLDERRISVVATRSDAFIEKVSDVTTGDKVAKGQDLVRLYSPDIATAGAQYVTELSDPERRSVLGGARQRLENLGAPADLIKEIERTRKVPLAVTWTASQDGIVLERNAIDGMKAAPGDVLFRIADVSTVWALADIAERDLPRIAPGQDVAVRVRGFDDRLFAGKVSLIYPQVNKETRTTRVRVELANPDGILRPDMYVEAEIATGTEMPVTAVPASAVIDSGTRQVVLIDKGEGRFEPRVVTVGRRGTDYVEIREGIAPGDDVVVAANFLIDAESNLKAALRGLSSDAQKPDQPKEKPL
ncbi:efflux RND transporter periplasmic adaptor subunit [Phyllobacterium zundukense]|uniref:Efflux transporter periplasmic adaptor subunit n=1 Tax=Phyllobacterium zundukense TaxID=1867719 RepID=A0A2N9VZX7_9HYPH|nr:efflux RND transporter periplasmic adaptor subunit [Phyllobacterium zundukense]ATU94477.1 efflux transporter periplasmic adaptor subunit [Phyllobacterium zundukense]PIO45045.1 efflux transporter periplasmic adaptor subunit [Phyllobacterium zundukense]